MLRRAGIVAACLVILTGAAPQHALSLRGTPAYGPDFSHFAYVNPQAPKGGDVRLGAIGTFDQLNPFVLKGVAAQGSGLVFATLMEKSADEPFSAYGLVAESVAVAPDRSAVTFDLRATARFHDGTPITPEDVVFSFTILRTQGHPHYRSYYRDVADVKKTGAHQVTFTLANKDNAELPLILGELPVLPAHAWKDKDFGATTLTPLIGSGPYRVKEAVAGRTILYERVKDWWGADLPVNRGRYNFDTLRFDYYRDPTVALEAFFAGRYDFRLENIAKNWATAYTTPAVKDGRIVRLTLPSFLPSGMQAFVINTRRPVFADPRVREALDLAYDFEWANKNIAFGAYKRTQSYFENSDFAARGTPEGAELALLEPYREQLPPALFTTPYQSATTDGTGNNRSNLRRAAALLAEAGWTMKNGVLVNPQGTQLSFTIVDDNPAFERWTLPWIRNLEILGIKANFRLVDSAQYQSMMDKFDFDVTPGIFPQSLSPGNEQRDFWSSAKADIQGARNYAGIKNPVVDALIEKIVAAQDEDALRAACRALDRVLLWNHYVVPQWHAASFRLAYWDMFGRPDKAPKYDIGMTDTWWVIPDKAAILRKTPAQN